MADRYPGRRKPATLLLREERVEAILGVRIEGKQTEKLLRSLGLKTQRQASKRENQGRCAYRVVPISPAKRT